MSNSTWDDEFYVHLHSIDRELTGECGTQVTICAPMRDAIKKTLVFSRSGFVLGLRLGSEAVIAFNYCPFCGGDLSKIATYLKPPEGAVIRKVINE